MHVATYFHACRATGGEIEEEKLRHLVLDEIEQTLEAARAKGDDDGESQLRDVFLTVHAALTSSQSSKGEVAGISCHAYPMPLASMPPAVTLEVRGEGRKEPEVKHSKVCV